MSQVDTIVAKESVPVVRIEPSRGWISINFSELWEYRELLYFLTWRDIKVRYKQTILGGLWAIIQPFFMMVVFSLFFGKLAKIPSDGIPYPIFAFAALVPWTFFANALTQSSNSLVGSAGLLKKVYFPRLVIPIASVMAGAVDFVLAFVVLLGMMLYYGFVPTANIMWLPLLLLMVVVTALGVGLWLSAMNVQFRDVRYTIPFLTQFWLFATPIIYPVSMIPERFRPLASLNPMTGLIEAFRALLLPERSIVWSSLLLSCFVALIVFVTGLLYFQKAEAEFADII